MDNGQPVTPYGSARDLPSIQALSQQFQMLKLVSWMLPAEQRRDLRAKGEELRRIPELVDGFYRLLGERNWVYTDDLSTVAIEHVIATDDSEEAERRVIAYYQEDGRLDFVVKRLFRFEQMRARLPLIRKALEDYRAGRFYAVVLVLIPVMDGFVNDIETASRRGLHARDPDDMVAWNSVTAHHLGLAHAHRSFVKPFRKTHFDEVTELYRNGILHGTIVNFDNVVVATKAWNRLFAVTDWAEARTKEPVPTEPVPSLRDSLKRWQEVRERSARVDAWQPHDYIPDLDAPRDVVQTCSAFLEQWKHRRWGLVGAHLLGQQDVPAGKRAVVAKDTFARFPLVSSELRKVRHIAAAVAVVDVTLHVGERAHQAGLRWVRIDGTGTSAAEWEPGTWLLAPYDPSTFLNEDNVIAD